MKKLQHQSRVLTHHRDSRKTAGKKTYCWTNKQPWLLFYEIWDGAGDRTSCWMTLFTFLLMSQEEARFIRLERKWLISHSHLCTNTQQTHGHVFTKGVVLEWVSCPRQHLGGGSSATPEMSPPLFLLPEPETLQLPDSQSGLGAAAD